MDKPSKNILGSCYGATVSAVYDASKRRRSFTSDYEQDAAIGEELEQVKKNGVPAGVQQEVRRRGQHQNRYEQEQ